MSVRAGGQIQVRRGIGYEESRIAALVMGPRRERLINLRSVYGSGHSWRTASNATCQMVSGLRDAGWVRGGPVALRNGTAETGVLPTNQTHYALIYEGGLADVHGQAVVLNSSADNSTSTVHIQITASPPSGAANVCVMAWEQMRSRMNTGIHSNSPRRPRKPLRWPPVVR
ncbi:MAG: hypothetical protein ACJ786_32620 [Catenulispora sp.]